MEIVDPNKPITTLLGGTVPLKPPLPKPQPKPRTRKSTTTLKKPATKKPAKAKPKPAAPKATPWVKVVTATNGVLVSVYIDAADWAIRFRTERGDTMDIALGETMPSEAMAAIGPEEVQTLLDWRALVSKVSGE